MSPNLSGTIPFLQFVTQSSRETIESFTGGIDGETGSKFPASLQGSWADAADAKGEGGEGPIS
jgi:hypothetical protein